MRNFCQAMAVLQCHLVVLVISSKILQSMVEADNQLYN